MQLYDEVGERLSAIDSSLAALERSPSKLTEDDKFNLLNISNRIKILCSERD